MLRLRTRELLEKRASSADHATHRAHTASRILDSLETSRHGDPGLGILPMAYNVQAPAETGDLILAFKRPLNPNPETILERRLNRKAS